MCFARTEREYVTAYMLSAEHDVALNSFAHTPHKIDLFGNIIKERLD